MNRGYLLGAGGCALIVAALALVPLFASNYHLALGISLLHFAVLATAWALFSGPTRYISLATVAFFGVGAYTVAVVGEILPWPLVLLTAVAIGSALAFVVGLSTLRLSGIYFVIFSFGLSELIRQLVTWYEVNIHKSVGRYVFIDITQAHDLLAAPGARRVGTAYGLSDRPVALGPRVARDRRGRGRGAPCRGRHDQGEDRDVCRERAVHDAYRRGDGAALDLHRPGIAFNPMLSFEVVIMALFGGAGALFGPILGVVPFVLLFEFLSANFPTYFSILLGLVFLAIVYALPHGVIGLIQAGWSRTTVAAAAVPPATKSNGLRSTWRRCARPSAGWSRSPISGSPSLLERSWG